MFMNLAQIKATLGISALDLSRQLDEAKAPTPWLRNWDNLNRVAVVVHEDVLKAIKENPTQNTLALKSERRMSKSTPEGEEGSPYLNHILIVSDTIEDTL